MRKIKLKSLLIAILITIAIIIIPNVSFGLTITIDAGHGGKDTGATNNQQNIIEKDVNLKMAKYLKQYLTGYTGINVILTRETDVFLEVYDRAIIGRNNKSDLFVSLHMNSSTANNVRGAEIYVTNNTALDKYKKETTALGNKILNNLNKLGIVNRGVRTKLITNDSTDIYSDGTMADYYGVIRYSMRGTKIDSGVLKPEGAKSANIQNGEGVPAILIEHCYINSQDYEFTNTDEKIKQLAKADSDAIAEFYGLKKIEKKKFKLNSTNIVIVPGIKLSDISSDAVGELKTCGKIKFSNKEYLVSYIGDSNGDGEINSADLLKIVKHLKQISIIENLNMKEASDTNFDEEINSADLLKIVKHLKGIAEISL